MESTKKKTIVAYSHLQYIREWIQGAWSKRWAVQNMLEYKYDVQVLIEGERLSEDKIGQYLAENVDGDSLLAVGDEELIKVHFHTNTPWKVLEYCASLGDISDIVIENMERQAKGLQE